MRIERWPSPHRIPGREGRRPEWIVIHTTDGPFGAAASWFLRPESEVSAHHLVGLDGRVVALVPEEDAARHAGRFVRPTTELARRAADRGESANLTTIGIELADDGDPQSVLRTDAQYTAAARLVAMASARWGIPLDARHVVGHRRIAADKTCPGNVSVERIRREARRWLAGGPAERTLVVGLLPVRNCAADLPRWLDAAPGWCDVVVALDDGSTDATATLLARERIVQILLRHPPRPTAAGWHDGRNRQALLGAAGGLVPDWIVQVDADEVLDAADAQALRTFLGDDALPGLAYGLRHVRAWGEDLVDPTPRWVYRAFAWQPDQRMPDRALHFNPVPIDIPRTAWVRTTIRLRHLGAASEDRIHARLAKYAEADPNGEHPVDHAGLDRPPARLVPWTERPAGLAVLAFGPSEDDGPADGRPLLAVLLPVRNGEQDLPGWFDRIGSLADAVVALDDGSTDGTGALFAAEPLLQVLHSHPPRPSAEGWDDARNRQELLDAAAELAPRWVLFLDADERIAPDDAAALRSFLASGDADRDAAYGFRVHRMTGEHTFDRADLWVYRLFAWRPGLLLPDERLHLVPIPVSVSPGRLVRTTVRIRHLASLTEERRLARLEKYRQADPEQEFQADYSHLVDAPGRPRPWTDRPPGLPVLADAPVAPDAPAESEREADGFDPDAPILSAIVIARDDADRIERVVRSVVSQECPEPFETIVVVSGSPRTAAIVRDRFPEVTLVEIDRPVLPGAARNAGLARARGDYVSFPGSHVELPPGSLAARLRAHERGYPMVTGTMLNGNPTPAGWAAYFLDQSGSLPGQPTRELDGPPAHCSYDREILQRTGGFPEHVRAGEDTAVNIELTRQGFKALRASDVVLIHASPCRTVPHLLRHHFARGRAFGTLLLERAAPDEPVLSPEILRRHLVAYLPRRLRGIDANVRAWADERLRAEHRRVASLVAAGAVAAWTGIWVEVLRPRRGKLERLLGRSRSADRDRPAR